MSNGYPSYQFYRIESELKKLFNLGSVFASVYEHMKQV
jgi:hypothetical protein